MKGSTKLSGAFRLLGETLQRPHRTHSIRSFSSAHQPQENFKDGRMKHDFELEKDLVGNGNENTQRRSQLATLSSDTRSKVNTRKNEDLLSKIYDVSKKPYNIEPPHHLHVYSHKHNTHITLTRPDRGPMLSVSSGNIGFRKSHRGKFDACHQLSSYMMGKIQERGFLMDIKRLEVVLRGFGPGREAFTKVLLGVEGRKIREKVVRVTDATRLKFGGARSQNVRRLG